MRLMRKTKFWLDLYGRFASSVLHNTYLSTYTYSKMTHIVQDILEWFFSHAWEVSLLTKYTCKLSCQLINASVALTWNTRDFRLNDKTGIVWNFEVCFGKVNNLGPERRRLSQAIILSPPLWGKLDQYSICCSNVHYYLVTTAHHRRWRRLVLKVVRQN